MIGILSAKGVILGTTPHGGTYNQGTVFQLTPPNWTASTLYSFGPKGGVNPQGTLYEDNGGALFGVSANTVFELTPPGKGRTEVTISSAGGGSNPSGGLIRKPGTRLSFYGISNNTVYSLTPPAAGKTNWTQVVLHSFGSGRDGQSPQGGLLLDTATGVLYGATSSGGYFGFGTVFMIKP